MTINIDLLLIIMSYLIPYLLLSFQLRSQPTLKSILENALYLHIGIWKGSYILFYFQDFKNHPLSFLYFSGGKVGLVLSIGTVVLYLGFKKHASLFKEAFKYVIVGILVFMIGTSTLTLLSNQKNEKQVTWATLSGQSVPLENKIVVLNFYASWCPPCKAELPQLNRFAEEIKDEQQIIFLGINATTTESSKAAAVSFVKKEHLAFPVLYDEKGDWLEQFSITTFPTTIFIDKNGRVIKKHVGPISKDSLHNEIQLLKR